MPDKRNNGSPVGVHDAAVGCTQIMRLVSDLFVAAAADQQTPGTAAAQAGFHKAAVSFTMTTGQALPTCRCNHYLSTVHWIRTRWHEQRW